jgi:pre-mRNA-splicing factor 38A
MTNRTDSSAKQIHGMNPQFLLETILRNKIYNTLYWKEKCFGLNSETIIDRAVELKYIGGTYGPSKSPTEFICLVLKLLQIQPDDSIINEYLNTEDYKYLRALAAFYLRLTGKHKDVYNKLEPLYNDYKKLRVRNPDGNYTIMHMDEYIEYLLTKDSIFEITLPSLPKRKILESNGELQPRVSLLEADLDINLDKEDDMLNDIELDKDKIKEEDNSISNESESKSDSDSDSEDEIKKVKKRKVESKKDDSKKELDPSSDEYWLELRKKILNNN